MKKIIRIICFATLLLSGCTVNELENPQNIVGDFPTFYASFSDAADETTKTYVDEDMSLRWTMNDRLSIFVGNTFNHEYKYDGETGANNGSFSAISTPEFVSAEPLDANYAVYPYNVSNEMNADGSMSVLLPSVQKYAENSFGLGANTMVAATENKEDNFLQFKNLCGYVVVKLYGEGTVTSVKLEGNDGEEISGKADVQAAFGTLPSVTMSEEATTSITLDCGDGVTLGTTAETATEFWLCVPPVTFSKGFTVTATKTDGWQMIKSTSSSKEVVRNTKNALTPIEAVFDTPSVEVVPPDDEIWYCSKNNAIINYLGIGILDFDDIGLYGKPFDAEVIDHYFDGTKCVIKCDKPITKINNRCFSIDDREQSMITSIMLPNSVEEIGRYCFNMADITEFRTPDNLKTITCPFINNNKLAKFTGKHTYDGLSIVLNNVLCIYANGSNNDNYVIPDGVIEIGVGAFDATNIKNITIPEGVKIINYDAFARTPLVSVTIPESVEHIADNAFDLCFSIQGYYGNNNFHTSDNLCFITNDNRVSGGKQLNAFAGHNHTAYVIPEGITTIRTMSFHYGGENLLSVTLPNSIVNVDALAFKDLPNLQFIYGPGTTSDNKGYVKNGELQLFLGKGISSYYIPEDVTSLGTYLFEYNNELEHIYLHDNVRTLGMDCFANCSNLKSITLSASISTFPFYCFKRSYNIESIYFRGMIPPKMSDDTCPGGFFPEKEYEKLTIYVPNESMEKYINADGWEDFAKYVKGYDYTDLPELDYYVSSDYSSDGQVSILQTATKGNGIDIIVMGDAYSDRQIADGTYRADIEYIYNGLFTEEPYKSYKDYFNVYYINVVSATEGYNHGNTALNGYFGDGTLVGGNDNIVFDYAINAVSEVEMDEALIIVAMNSDKYAGTCYLYYPSFLTGNYGTGTSVAYFPKGGNQEIFAQLLHHEALGHGFAKLADEYAYEENGSAPIDYVSEIKSQQSDWGWWKNVDFTSDPTLVKWSKFLSDERYANEGLGCFEGGLTYWSGVWRPTDNSIMRNNTGGFNAPSREAIWYRIHKLAYGEDWEYNYEDFVVYDAINRTPAAQAASRAKVKAAAAARKGKPFQPLHEPVVVKRSWKEAMNNPGKDGR